MITGDHALTARAIAHQIGLNGVAGTGPVAGGHRPGVGGHLRRGTARRGRKGGRVRPRRPEQKLRLVKALQARGHVVAMTGDGVNDAPRSKQADIGVAMGIAGTDVAKGAADMVLTDDNFASIEAAVEEGRNVFDNLTKFIVWTLPTNFGEGLVILAAVLLGVALPILPVQILWINMTTVMLLGLMLAFEPKEPRHHAAPAARPAHAHPDLAAGDAHRAGVRADAGGAFGFRLGAGRARSERRGGRTIAVNVIVVRAVLPAQLPLAHHSMFQVGVRRAV
jgi:cation-transporting P-type ATPase F